MAARSQRVCCEPSYPPRPTPGLRPSGAMGLGGGGAAAIRRARDGFPMYPLMAASLKRHDADHRAWPSTAAIFLPNGRVPEPGELFRQPDFGRSLPSLG